MIKIIQLENTEVFHFHHRFRAIQRVQQFRTNFSFNAMKSEECVHLLCRRLSYREIL
jgi:hypothetical protein